VKSDPSASKTQWQVGKLCTARRALSRVAQYAVSNQCYVRHRPRMQKSARSAVQRAARLRERHDAPPIWR